MGRGQVDPELGVRAALIVARKIDLDLEAVDAARHSPRRPSPRSNGDLQPERLGCLLPSLPIRHGVTPRGFKDLRCYHRECADQQVVPVLVPTRAKGRIGEQSGVQIVGPDVLDQIVYELTRGSTEPATQAKSFLAESAYRPLPTLGEG